MVRRHGLRDDQWERIQDVLPGGMINGNGSKTCCLGGRGMLG